MNETDRSIMVIALVIAVWACSFTGWAIWLANRARRRKLLRSE